MPTRKAKPSVVPELLRPQRRPQPPQPTPLGERRLGAAHVVRIEQVLPDPDQPRRDWAYDDGERKLDELAASIRAFGVLSPLVVREDGRFPDGRLRYVIIAGGRRRAAAERAGLPDVPILVRGEEGARVRILQLVENIQRQGLAPLDEARAFQELIDLEGLTPPQLASQLNVSAQHIRDRLRLLTDQVIADAVAGQRLTIKAAKNLQQLPDEALDAYKQRILRGETVTYAEVQATRQRLQANGVINPRYMGGGRGTPRANAPDGVPLAGVDPARESRPAAPPLAGAPVEQEQNRFASDSFRVRDVDTITVGFADDAVPASAAAEQNRFASDSGQGMIHDNEIIRPGGATSPEQPGAVGPAGARGAEPGHPAALVAVAQQIVALVHRAVGGEYRAQITALANQITDRDDPSIWALPLALGLWRSFADTSTESRVPAARETE